jgi:flagellar motor switch protein FliN/FliY
VPLGAGKEINSVTDETSSIPASSPPSDSAARSFMQVWAESMAHVLGQIAGSPFAVECLPGAPPEAPPAQEADVRITIVAAGGVRGEMSFRIAQAVMVGVAQLFLSEPQDAAVDFKPDHQEAAEELLRQVAGHAATSLKPRWGEVQLRLESGAPPSWPPAASGWLASGSATACRLWLEWQLSAALNAALVTASQPAESKPLEPRQEDAGAGQGNLDLLMDVELEVTLRFGQRIMLLRDILELDEGSVVELDRQVEEPVELLLDGKLIARGEVVVVDGSYGLRIQEMVTSAPA